MLLKNKEFRGGHVLKKIFLLILSITLIVTVAGCTSEKNMVMHTGIDESWSIALPEGYVKDKEEQIEEHHITTYIKDDNEKFTIGEFINSEAIVDEDFFENEIGEDSYMHAQKKEVVDVEGFGKVYGVIGDDHSTNNYFMYYKTKINDKVISFLAYRAQAFTSDEEKEMKDILSNLKIKE